MFPRVASVFTFLFFVLPLLAAATAVPRTDSPSGGGSTTDQCNSGDAQCCNQVLSQDDPLVGILAGLLGVVLGLVDGLVGVNCTPILGGVSCSSQTVCCTDNSFNGLINLGCSPLNINL